ncbi:MAG: YggS family pyridoxal phosphate-dependent enzyme [Anaerolineae bacterium]|nr:YggS family pyridoxal phosphate-dependent enzyme [Anaerolineae bacterium]
MSSLAERLEHVQTSIEAACQRANRPLESVTLIAVSKTHPAESVIEAVGLGLRHFGENRVEEASGKIPTVLSATNHALTWHMIGHVQSRKAEDVIAAFDVIHSLDTLKLAERYSRYAGAAGKTARVLLEVNVSGEASKSGLEASGWEQNAESRTELWKVIQQITVLPYLQIDGLMTMAPIVDDMEQTRPVFASLRRLREALASDFPAGAWAHLSMGMTDDYPVAIEEGATMVRIGRAIFGDRTY